MDDWCASVKLYEKNGRLYVLDGESVWVKDCWWPLSVAGMMLQASYYTEGVRALCRV